MSLVLEDVSLQHNVIQLEWESIVFFDSEDNDEIEICDFVGLFDKCVNATMSVVAMCTCELQQSRNMLSWRASAFTCIP